MNTLDKTRPGISAMLPIFFLVNGLLLVASVDEFTQTAEPLGDSTSTIGIVIMSAIDVATLLAFISMQTIIPVQALPPMLMIWLAIRILMIPVIYVGTTEANMFHWSLKDAAVHMHIIQIGTWLAVTVDLSVSAYD